ncbi:MAG TPA: TraB/GumN family protein [Novosphingobium sp.]|nr:TraB/GumN family protein [Novosphingobium sp.]
MRLFKSFIAPLALTAAFLGPATLAQQSVPTPQKVEAVPAPVIAKPALWKISDADTTIYLFGTIHLLPKGIEWFDGPVANAFEKADILVTEIPEVPEAETIAMTLKHGTLPQGQSLRGLMSAEERGKYESAMATMGLPPAVFDRYKPWFASMALAIFPLQKAGYSMENGIENQLDKRNKDLGRPRIGLETLDYQLGIFDSLPPEVQKAYLFAVIDALPTMTQDIQKMVDAWAKGDVDSLAALLNAETDDPVLYDALLTQRNRNWAVWIDKRLDQPGTVFIAVGAGHLGGNNSVQEFLDRAGIRSARVQ